MLSLNNGIQSKKKLQKCVSWVLSDSDNDVQSYESHQNDRCISKGSSSTRYSPTANYQIQEQIDVGQFEMNEKCVGFFEEGYCDRGCDCTYVHEVRQIKDIKEIGKKMKFLQNFPQLILITGQKRLNSFLF